MRATQRKNARARVDPATMVLTECEPGNEDWGFNHGALRAWRGYDRWAASEFRRMPTLQEIDETMLTWEDDLVQCSRLVAHQRGDK